MENNARNRDLIDDGRFPSENTIQDPNIGVYEMVNHPNHYNLYRKEVIDMMVDIWGKEDVAKWCEITAFKYRMRMGMKPENSIEQDLKKEMWYLKKATELRLENK